MMEPAIMNPCLARLAKAVRGTGRSAVATESMCVGRQFSTGLNETLRLAALLQNSR